MTVETMNDVVDAVATVAEGRTAYADGGRGVRCKPLRRGDIRGGGGRGKGRRGKLDNRIRIRRGRGSNSYRCEDRGRTNKGEGMTI